MIVGFAGSRAGLAHPQKLILRQLFTRLPMDAFIHRGRGNIDTLAHNMVREIRPLLPIHVLPLLDEHSVIATMEEMFPTDKRMILYQRGDSSMVNTAIVNSVSGIICAPKATAEDNDGWDLVHAAREYSVPVFIVWPDGTVLMERNHEL